MTCNHERLKLAVADVAGGSHAFNNFVEGNPYLTTEIDYGLKWLAHKLDEAIVELEAALEELAVQPPLKTVKE